MTSGRRSLALRLWGHSGARTGLLLLGLVVVFAVAGPWLIGTDPNQSDFALSRSAAGGPPGPSWAHPLGSDSLFRDVLARLAAGARLSLLIAACATIIATCLGATVGMVSGYFGDRWPDRILTGVVDIALAFPFLLLITAIGVAMAQTDAVTVTLVLGLTGWPGVARVVRAKTRAVTACGYVRAARALGVDHRRMLWRHIVPALQGTLLVLASQMAASMILAEAVLGYLTVGVPPPQASWGRMLHEAEHFIGVTPSLVAAPAVCILLTVLGLIRLSDGVSEVLDDEPTAGPRGAGASVDLFLVGLTAVLVLLTRPAPLPSPALAAATESRDELRLASHVRVYHLDPALAYDEASRDVLDMVMARLVRFDGKGRVQPQLAEQVEVAADGLLYRFRLREGLRFHDGSPLVAADVKRSLERSLHPDTPCPAAELFSAIDGFGAFRDKRRPSLQGVRATKERVLEIKLARPDASFLSVLTMAFAAPVCAPMGAVASLGRAALPCGAGPFKVELFESGSKVRLVRFADYFEASRPRVGAVLLSFGVPARTQRYQFEAGEIDIIRELSGVDTTRFLQSAAWAKQRAWVRQPQTSGIFLNTELRPFDNRHLRRAVSLAIDREQLARVNPNNEVSHRIVPAALLPAPASFRPRPGADLPGALREMALAGFAFDPVSKEGGYPYEIPYVVVPGTFEQMAAEVFQQQLARVGIRLRLELMNWAAQLQHVSTRGAAVMGWRGWAADYPDPSAFFEPTLSSAAIADRGGQNISFFSDPRLDSTLAKADRETNVSARLSLFYRAEEIVGEEAPWIPVYAPRRLHVWHHRVRGYDPSEPFALERVTLRGGEP